MVLTSSSFREKLMDFLVSFLLSWGIGTASLLCLYSAFPIPADRTILVRVVGLCSFAVSIAYLFRQGWIVVSSGWVIGLGILLIWFSDPLVNGTKMILETLLGFYSCAYPNLSLSIGEVPLGYTATLPMCLWGVMIVTLCAWTILRQQTPVGVLVLSAFPLALCMVVVDTPPDRSYLFQYLICVALLVITQGCRCRDRVAGNRLCLLLILPITLLVLGLHSFLPEWPYSRKPWSDELLQQIETLLPSLHTGDGFSAPSKPSESFYPETPLDMGPPKFTGRPVLEVAAPTSGTIYLRGTALGEYSKNRWSPLKSTKYSNVHTPSAGFYLQYEESEVTKKKMHIITYGDNDVVYTPYYLSHLPYTGDSVWDYAIRNTNYRRSYDIAYCTEPPQALYSSRQSDSHSKRENYDAFAHALYTKLPRDTQKGAKQYLQAHGLYTEDPTIGPDPSSYTQQIAELVRSSATYDINTPPLPQDKDFVLWFLEESPTGYCVHFASATVVLLRAAGIPARFVTGYVVNAEAGTPVTVLDSNAHAWAEYYVDGIGWIPLDATPGEALENILQPEETTPQTTTEQTLPDETTSHTEPSTEAPTHETVPSESAPSAAMETTPDAPEATKQFRIPGWIFLLPVLVLLALAYRPIVLYLRRRKLKKLPDNEAFLLCWHYSSCLARWLKVSQNTCMDLALKARFSQHTMDKEDWDTFHNWQDALELNLSSASFIKRILVHRILLWDAKL